MPRTDQEGCDNMLGSNCTGREQTSMANPRQEGADAASCASRLPATGVGRQTAQGTADRQGDCRPTHQASPDPAEHYTAMLEAGFDNCQAYRMAYLGRSTSDVLGEDAAAVPTPPPDPAALYTTLLENGTDRLEAWERSFGAEERGASPTSPLAAKALTGSTKNNAAAGQHTDRAHLFQMLASMLNAATVQQDTAAQPPLSATARGTGPSTMEAEPLPLGTQPNGPTRTGNAHQVFLAEKKAGTVFGAPVGGAKTACAATTDDDAWIDEDMRWKGPNRAGIPSAVDFIYGDISFSIPWTWYQQYRREGAASTVDQTLAVLWAPFLSDLVECPVTKVTVSELLGCYNIGKDGKDQDGNPYLFWSDGWGAPFECFQTAVRMVAVYHGYIVDNWSGTDWCVGFGDFVYTLLQGKEAWRSPNSTRTCQPARLVINFNSADIGYQGRSLTKPCGGTYDCGYGYGETDCGKEWAALEVKFDTTYHYWYATPYVDKPLYPDTGCRVPTATTGYNYIVNMHPISLAFDAYRCDYLMHWARVAMDYAFSGLLAGDISPGEASEYLLAASRLGRFALDVISSWGLLLIHELGHNFTGEGHCDENSRNCYEIARYAWQCSVRGRLGLLYASPYWPSINSHANEKTNTGLGGGRWRCDVGEYGRSGMKTAFCSTVCPDKEGGCTYLKLGAMREGPGLGTSPPAPTPGEADDDGLSGSVAHMER